MKEKIVSGFIKHSSFLRPLLFAVVLVLHVMIIYACNFKDTVQETETVDFREAEVFKLVDVQEYVKPEPVIIKKETVKVSVQPKASETLIETEKEVIQEQEENDYLPQHKISAVPVIPSGEVLSKIVYPKMALKQGIEAVVFLELFIDSKGEIKNIKILKDPGYGFAEAAVQALKGIRCIPANVNGKNCAVRYRYPVKFTLN